MERPPVFALADHGLKNLTGHNLTYARRVLSAAAALGFHTVAGVGVEGTDLEVGAESHAVFAEDVWANNPAEGRLWHARAFLDRNLGRPALPSSGSVDGDAAAPPAEPTPPPNRLRRLLDGFMDDGATLIAGRRQPRAFADALQRFLDAADLTAGDIVYLPTALAGELGGLALLLARSAPARRLRWRVLLRYAPQSALVRSALVPAARRLVRRTDADVRLYSDTEHLCRFYERLCGTSCHLVPVPVAASPSRRPHRPAPLTIGYFGDARDEKGFDLLPEVVRLVRRASAPVGGLRFLIQANLNTPAGDPRTRHARQVLAGMADDELELVEGPLTPDAYDTLFARADIILLPYRPGAYEERSSGVLMEALTAGLPCVATGGAWMASVLGGAEPPAGRIASPDATALADALLKVAADWGRYAEGAHALAVRLRPRCDPLELVRTLAAP